ncbi:uncharacterized protein LOC123532402 [Mercenaria mercenaria]|uniref:uncharacterized protein LOC123532402 n=1 Tax=Mercenaria mercenaria TaxID=6596 RepID=UPI001E1D7349|nr:uncharacterized protein LOC123532402 [Mercenaria mercenaria]
MAMSEEVQLTVDPAEEEIFMAQEAFPAKGMCCPVNDCYNFEYFQHPSDLKRHMIKIHLPMHKEYVCNKCGEHFARIRGYNAHASEKRCEGQGEEGVTPRFTHNDKYIDPKGVRPPLGGFVKIKMSPFERRQARKAAVGNKFASQRLQRYSRDADARACRIALGFLDPTVKRVG